VTNNVGGDVELNDLQMRLDGVSSLPFHSQKALQDLVNDSIIFKEGKIGRFHLHVPWNAIQSQPVQVKLDGVEFVVEPNLRTKPTASSPQPSPSVPPRQPIPQDTGGYGRYSLITRLTK
jgi:hypothetical protein